MSIFTPISWLAFGARSSAETAEEEQSFSERLLLERYFLRTLRLERETAFMLMLVDVEGILRLRDGQKILPRVMAALFRVIREIDSCGWHRRNSTIGVIFTEISARTRGSVKEAIESKIWNILHRELRADQYDKVRISFEFFPESENGRPPAGPVSANLYPDLFVRDRRQRISQVMKRLMDIAGSVAALLLLAPLFALIGFVIKMTSRGPIFFRQIRVGQPGIAFTFLKFRTMYEDSDSEIHRDFVKQFITGNGKPHSSEATAVYKITSDPRVTKVGRFLRRTSLDELPQFANVLRGEMSLVGPRPPIVYEMDEYQPWHRRRILEVKPGITGLWQVKGRSRIKFDDMVRLDMQYARARSLWLDLKILMQTPKAVFSGDGAY